MEGGKDNAHTVMVSKVLIALGKMPKLCRAWKNATGSAKSWDGKRVIHYGLKGSADITGILNNGKRIEIEIKTGQASQSKEQKNFQKMVTLMGGVYGVARNEDDAVQLVKKNALVAANA